MDDFTFYANKNGVMWYRCNHCKNLTRAKPNVCPVCMNQSIHTENESTITDEAFERSLQKLQDVIKKYER